MVNRTRMTAQLVLHEGLRTAPYLDTVKKWTIGVGYNISDRGLQFLEDAIGRTVSPRMQDLRITNAEALLVLDKDITRFESAVQVHFPEYAGLDEVRQRVCLDLAFNMGLRALGFNNTIAAIKRHDWSTASRHLWKSKWAGQVDDGPGKHWGRADRLTTMLLTGQDYTA